MTMFRGKTTMTRMTMMKLAASTMVLGGTFAGASTIGIASSPTAMSEARAIRVAASAARGASKALVKKDAQRAIGFAETAVAAQPRDAGYRMLLGQAYLAGGRFASAEASFADTLTLDPNRERAALNLTLSQIAQGKHDAALATLRDYREKLPAADYGLATALAGNPQEAVRVLEVAARAPDANAKTRQNLALAYALAGNWASAKVLAVQDLPPVEADARIVEWASFAKPATAYDQVASLLGVRAVADGGMPTRLALNVAPTVVQTAQVEAVAAPVPPAPIAEAPVPAPVEVAMVPSVPEPSPAPAFEVSPVTQTPAPVEVARVVPVIHAERAPARRPVVKATIKATAQPATFARASGPSRFVVQLGAFSTGAASQRAWSAASGRFDLASYDPVAGTAHLRNASLFRLSVGGFATRSDADRVCGKIRSSGGACFVRAAHGDAPTQWVARAKPTRVASR